MYADVAEEPVPLILLLYQVEIRLTQSLHRFSLVRVIRGRRYHLLRVR